MNVELVAQMFKNYQSNVLFHLEGNLFYQYLYDNSTNILKLRILSKIPRDGCDGKMEGLVWSLGFWHGIYSDKTWMINDTKVNFIEQIYVRLNMLMWMKLKITLLFYGLQ